MNTNQLIEWLTNQANQAPTYSERVAYLNVIRHIKEQSNDN